MATDLSPLVAVFQDQNRLIAAIQQALIGAAPGRLPAYAVAALPTSAPIGTMAYASNGRKPGEGGGAGSGVPVFFDTSGVWFSVSSGAQVTV